MKHILLSLLLAVCALGAGAQQTINDPNAVKRDVSGYHAIEVSAGIDLYLSHGEESVAVSAGEAKWRDKIITEVVNGVLKIRLPYDEGIHISIGINRKLKAYVSYKELDQLTGSGGSDIFVDGSIKGTKLKLRLSGGSDFKGKVELNELVAGASGGSDLNISGVAQSLDIDVSGGSDFHGYELSTENCKVEASGGSDVYISVNRDLQVNASGGSDVYYKGNGSIKDVRSSGSSNIKKMSR